jgi:hypothetical protein
LVPQRERAAPVARRLEMARVFKGMKRGKEIIIARCFSERHINYEAISHGYETVRNYNA